jgi:hypothetical protein
MADILSTPRYAKMIAKIARMKGPYRNLFIPDELEAQYMDERMRNALIGMDLAAQKKSQTRSLSLGRQGLSLGRQRLGLAKDRFDFGKGQNRLATLFGALSLPIAGLSAYGTLKESDAIRKQLYEQAGLYRRRT